MGVSIHHLADVGAQNIGEGTTIWQYVVILSGARIGMNCNINCHTFIEGDVVIGDNVTVKCGVYLWDGITIEDDVFIGPNCTFINDKFPRSKKYPEAFQKIILKKGCSLGAGCIVMGNIEIGEYSIIGAGALITKSIPPHALVIGNPGKVTAWINKDGSKMKITPDGKYQDSEGNFWLDINGKLTPASNL